MPRIYSDPKICGGEPCIDGTRISIFTIAHMYDQCNGNINEVKNDYPFLSTDDIKFAVCMAKSLRNPIPFYDATKQYNGFNG